MCNILGFNSQTWTLLDKDQNITCSSCGKLIPSDVYVLSNKFARKDIFCCYTAECLINHPLNENADSIKVSDPRADITMKKTYIVRSYGMDYWNRGKFIPCALKEFEESYEV